MPTCHLLFDHFQFALIHGPNIPGSYAILLFAAPEFTSITSHIHNWVWFLLWLCLFILSGVISPLISSSIVGTYRPGEFIFQCPIFLPFHTVLGVLKGRILPFPSSVDHILSELSTMTCLSWMALQGMAHSFIELDKAVVHVIRLASFLWLWFQSVCPLMPSLSTCCLIGVSLTLDMGYLFTAAPYFGRGVSPLSCSLLFFQLDFSQTAFA